MRTASLLEKMEDQAKHVCTAAARTLVLPPVTTSVIAEPRMSCHQKCHLHVPRNTDSRHIQRTMPVLRVYCGFQLKVEFRIFRG